MEIINKIIQIRKKHTLTEIFWLIVHNYIFEIVRMEKHGMYVHESKFEEGEIPYSMEVCKEDEYNDVLQSNPYLTENDINAFSHCKSVCAVVKDKGKIIASQWFITDTDYYLDEGKQIIHIKENEYYAMRSFTDEDYRGKNLQNHLVLKLLEHIESPEAMLWGLLFSWNTSSRKAIGRNGYYHTGNMFFIMLFGLKFQYLSK